MDDNCLLVGMPFRTNIDWARYSLDCWEQTSDTYDTHFLVIDNYPGDDGLTYYAKYRKIDAFCIHNKVDNPGMFQNMRQLCDMAKTKGFPYCAMVHCDSFVWETGWDYRIMRHFKEYPKCGIIGLFGSTGISPEGCRCGEILSNVVNAEAHGKRAFNARMVSVLDGFALFYRTEVLDQCIDLEYWEQVDYDYDVCMESLANGWENWLVPLKCSHLSGITGAHQVYVDYLAAKYPGGCRDVEVHNYNRWVQKWSQYCPVMAKDGTYEWRKNPPLSAEVRRGGDIRCPHSIG